jgi:hypothetical protein
MFQQGTLADVQRGPISSTSQRESPSAVFGVSTPGRAVYQGGIGEADVKKRIAAGSITATDVNVIGRRGGHSIVLDDGDLEGKDNLVRIRTGGGHQITMSDDGNFFYIIHANGQAWLEFGQEGTIDLYATNSVNVRTQGTINLHADKDINMFAKGTINMKSMLGTTIETEKKLTLSSTDDMTLYSKARIAVRADGILAIVSNKGSWNAGSAMVLQAGGIDLNGGSADTVDPPVPLEKRVMPDTEFNNATGWQISATGLESIVTRAPTHEPWPFHNQGVDTVCLTLGSQGVKLSQKGKEVIQMPAIKIDKVMDSTGAGDAFWSGFLFAHIKEKSIHECLEIALKLAALKLQNVGRLPDNINILSQLL